MSVEMVIAGVILDAGKVLLRRHPTLGKWLPPGGHILPGETPDDAVRRELREETGLLVEPTDYAHLPPIEAIKKELALPFYVNVHSVGDHDHCCFFYRCRVVGHTNEPPEPAELRWFDVRTLDEAPEVPEDVKYIVKLAAKKM